VEIIAKHKAVTYPAVFIKDAETHTITVIFPDVPSAISQANTVKKAESNAEEVLELMLYDEVKLPLAARLDTIRQDYPKDDVQLITAEFTQTDESILDS